MSRVNVAPSILSADFSVLETEVAKMDKAGATFIHLDVMDGRFVPNKTFGPETVARIVPYCGKMLRDAHLMVYEPLEAAEGFARAGAELITFHYEAYETEEERLRCIEGLRKLGVKVGISIKPATKVEVLDPYFPLVDLVLIMSVEPGKGGQAFMENSLEKIAYCRKKIDALGRKVYLEVDGGINQETGRLVVEKGADVLVAGSYLYGHDDYAQRLEGLMNL